MPISVCVAGAAGRMGSRIAQAVEETADLELAGLLVAHGESADGQLLVGSQGPRAVSNPADTLAPGRVLVDFTAPPATAALVELAAKRGSPFVSGSTALEAGDLQALDRAAERIPVLHAPNMSRGVEVLGQLIRQAAAVLGSYDLEIVERHHRRKADAPSGTALRLAQLAARARGEEAPDLRHGRVGVTGEREIGTIGMHALRGGDWVGEHAVILAGPGETLELHHRAESREVFVAGTLACIRFVANAPPGRYGMADVLGGTR